MIIKTKKLHQMASLVNSKDGISFSYGFHSFVMRWKVCCHSSQSSSSLPGAHETHVYAFPSTKGEGFCFVSFPLNFNFFKPMLHVLPQSTDSSFLPFPQSFKAFFFHIGKGIFRVFCLYHTTYYSPHHSLHHGWILKTVISILLSFLWATGKKNLTLVWMSLLSVAPRNSIFSF